MKTYEAAFIVERALRRLGVLDAVEKPELEATNEGLNAFFELLDGWNNDGLMIPMYRHLSFKVGIKRKYSWGIGADFDSEPPHHVSYAFWRSGEKHLACKGHKYRKGSDVHVHVHSHGMREIPIELETLSHYTHVHTGRERSGRPDVAYIEYSHPCVEVMFNRYPPYDTVHFKALLPFSINWLCDKSCDSSFQYCKCDDKSKEMEWWTSHDACLPGYERERMIVGAIARHEQSSKGNSCNSCNDDGNVEYQTKVYDCIDPCNSTPETVYIYGKPKTCKLGGDINLTGGRLELPHGYTMAAVNSLAVYLAPEYGVQVPTEVAQSARSALKRIRTRNHTPHEMLPDAASPFGYASC